jgi:tetratricopeptide (TPR) repeat protein
VSAGDEFINQQLHQELEQRQSKLIEWSWLRFFDLNLANGKPVEETVRLLEELGTTKKSAVLTEKLADLYAAQGKPSSAAQFYLQALKLDPSSQQRLRLMLTLGEKLIALERPLEAYETYRRLLQEFPDYPGKLAVYQRLLPIAQKLNKALEAEKYEAEIKSLSAHGKS